MPAQPPQMPALNQALDANLRMQNTSNNLKQIQRLQDATRIPKAIKPRAHRLASSAEARPAFLMR